jgi:hypothetical protein
MQIPKASTERPAALEGFLVGLEAALTPGLAVAATQRLRSINAAFKQEGNVEAYGSSGSWLMNRYVQGTEWASAPYSGWGSFTEDHLIFMSTHGDPVLTTVGTAGKKRVWTPDPFGLVDPRTFTMAAGQASRGELYPCGFFNGYKMTFTKASTLISGTILSQAIQDNVAITGSPTFIALQPMLGKHTYVKFATTYAGLAGATKYRRAFETSFEFSNMFSLLHPLTDDNISFDGLAQQVPTVAFTAQTNKTATAMTFLTSLRNSDVIYWEIGNIFPTAYEAGRFHTLKITLCTQVSAPFDDATVQNVKGVNWKFGIVPADDAPAPIQIELENNIA